MPDQKQKIKESISLTGQAVRRCSVAIVEYGKEELLPQGGSSFLLSNTEPSYN